MFGEVVGIDYKSVLSLSSSHMSLTRFDSKISERGLFGKGKGDICKLILSPLAGVGTSSMQPFCSEAIDFKHDII